MYYNLRESERIAMSRVKIGVAARKLGVSVATLRKWEMSGELTPDYKTESGTRYYNLERLQDAHLSLSEVSSRDLIYELLRRDAAIRG